MAVVVARVVVTGARVETTTGGAVFDPAPLSDVVDTTTGTVVVVVGAGVVVVVVVVVVAGSVVPA